MKNNTGVRRTLAAIKLAHRTPTQIISKYVRFSKAFPYTINLCLVVSPEFSGSRNWQVFQIEAKSRAVMAERNILYKV